MGYSEDRVGRCMIYVHIYIYILIYREPSEPHRTGTLVAEVRALQPRDP